MRENKVRQIVYTSTASRGFETGQLGPILYSARFHNRQNQVTGLLLFDGKRFLQALEGDADDVDFTVARIRTDTRHRSIVVLSDRTVERREFGNWDMAARSGDAGHYNKEIDELVATVTCPDMKATFIGFVASERKVA